jgi:hypothetical protein
MLLFAPPVSLPTIAASLAVLVGFWMSYRLYRRIGRRCRKCGAIFANHRINKIRLAPDETISLLSAAGRLRWWMRRVDTETYSICECGWKESVKISKGPISVWHAWSVRLTDRQQFFHDSELLAISHQAARDRRLLKDLGQHANLDTPPLVVWPRGKRLAV